MNITRHAIEQKGVFEGLDLNTLLIIGIMSSIIIIILTIAISIKINSIYEYEIDAFKSIIYGFLSTLIIVTTLLIIIFISVEKSIDDYYSKMNEIEITGETKIENVTTSDEYRYIATYQHDNKSYFINFATDDSVNINKDDTVIFKHYKEKVLKNSSTVTVTNSDIKKGKVKIKHN